MTTEARCVVRTRNKARGMLAVALAVFAFPTPQLGAADLPKPAERMANGKMDEVAIWDRPLDDAAVAALYELGQQGRALWKVDTPPPSAGPEVATINVVKPEAPQPPSEPLLRGVPPASPRTCCCPA